MYTELELAVQYLYELLAQNSSWGTAVAEASDVYNVPQEALIVEFHNHAQRGNDHV